MISKFSVHSASDSAPGHLRRLVPDLRSWRDYYIETATRPSRGQLSVFESVLIDPVTQSVEHDVDIVEGEQVQVAYKRGIVDNENESLIELCALAGIEATAARVAVTYASSDPRLADVIAANACNQTIEELHLSEPRYDSLRPIGSYEPAETYDLRGLDDDELTTIASGNGRVLDLDQIRRIREIQLAEGLEHVTDVLLEALDARWSDHCAHTTWKSLGNLLHRLIDAARATGNTNIVSMFADNAGVWDFYDGYAIAIKPETHNGPSAVSAYFGQLTKIGGVLRDILGTGKGADPIGVFEYTATGRCDSPSPIAGRPTSKQIANETIRAVKEYGNTFGVPMMWSHMSFHPAYRAKPFALGGSIGLVPLAHADKGRARAGDHVVLIGGLTGNDGIHGASGSSAGAVMDATSVQIGSPLEEIKFREAILELRDVGVIGAITDLGAAGINSAVGEMGEGVGVWINTALVPLKTAGLPMWRILISESQERMVLAIAPDNWEEARRVLARHEVRNTVIGRFTGDDRYRVVHGEAMTEADVIALDATAIAGIGEAGLDIGYDRLDYEPPRRDVVPPTQRWHTESKWPSIDLDALVEVMPKLLGDNEVCDQSYASLQYDASVQGRSWYGPAINGVATGYHACRPVFGNDAAAVFSASFNPWLFEAHPVRAARQMFLNALLKQVLAGVAPRDVCMADNFYTPDAGDDAYGWLVAMVNELSELSVQFGVPFISGKDSSAGSTRTDEGMISVPPAVFVSALGKVEHTDRLRPEVPGGQANLVVRIGLQNSSLAGTAAARVFDIEANDVDEVSPQSAYTFIQQLALTSRSTIVSGRVIGDGGVVSTVMKMALAGGVTIDLDTPAGGCAELLAEHRCGAVVEVPESCIGELSPNLSPVVIGRVSGDTGPGVRVAGVQLSTADAMRAWSTSYEEALT